MSVVSARRISGYFFFLDHESKQNRYIHSEAIFGRRKYLQTVTLFTGYSWLQQNN